jgi:hypothetical protein
VTKSDLLEVHGIGENAANALMKDGVTTTEQLKRALQELSPPAGHIYSSFQLDILSAMDLPTIGDQSVSQYTRKKDAGGEVRYEWKQDTETFVIELQKEGDEFRAEWFSSSEDKPFRSELFNHRADAVDALTRWAYRPPESA